MMIASQQDRHHAELMEGLGEIRDAVLAVGGVKTVVIPKPKLTFPDMDVTFTPAPADITEEPPVGSRLTDSHWHVWRRGERGWGIEGMIPGSNLDNPWSIVQQYAPLAALEPAPADVDPDEAWARERWAESANIASWSALHPETQRVLVDFARAAREHIEAERPPETDWEGIHLSERRKREKAEADLARVTKERDRLTHLLGSHADGHRCTCEMIDPGKPGIEPPTWEQDPWCLTHPDMDVIVAEVKALKAKADRYDALREDVDREYTNARDVREHRTQAVFGAILDRDDERAES